MRQVLQTLAALAAFGAVGAVGVVGFGLYNVSARQGHLPGVGIVLHTTFKQSVRLRAPGPEAVPDTIDHPDRIALGAMHFQTACAFCHSAPGRVRSATSRAMNPPPPHIAEIAAAWQPRQLFWIIREGIKMSGMPAWPVPDHEDEIWSVVAYLNAVPDMAVDQKSALAGADLARSTCSDCHGQDGRSTNTFVPRLDILTREQIADALFQYRSGARSSGIMAEVAVVLDDDAIAALATRFGRPEGPDTGGDLSLGPANEGRALATRGTDDVPACIACHGPGRRADAPVAPALSGQAQQYLATQLRLWRAGGRGGGKRAETMRKAAQDLSDANIETLADWFAGLDPAR